MKIQKISETRPLAGHIANEYDNSQNSAYATKYVNQAFGGTILWENSSPSSDMPINTKINLSSSDYDVLEIYYKDRASSTYVQSTRVYKRSNIMLNAIWNTSRLMRLLDYVDDTQYNVLACNSEGGNSASVCIPLYIIGYKTGLFN